MKIFVFIEIKLKESSKHLVPILALVRLFYLNSPLLLGAFWRFSDARVAIFRSFVRTIRSVAK